MEEQICIDLTVVKCVQRTFSYKNLEPFFHLDFSILLLLMFLF